MVVRQIPWPGPRPYTEDLADVFLGREVELGRILDMLQGENLSLMTASSGAGKTSLIQAGLVPAIRAMRLEELVADPTHPPLAPFPLLLNQWLGRAGKNPSVDYAQLVTLEVHRYLQRSLTWYRDRLEQSPGAEQAAALDREIENTRQAVARIAEYARTVGFAAAESDDAAAHLAWTDPGDRLNPNDQREVATRLCEVLDLAAGAFGEVLLILDQFEEVLLDSRLGGQAVSAVESVLLLRPHTIRQFISMRHDGLHLVDALNEKGLLESKRRVKIEPLTVMQTEDVISRVSRAEGHGWSAEPDATGALVLPALVRAFADAPGDGTTRVGQVNLIGLQVVLNGIFRHHLQPSEPVTFSALEAYCHSLARKDAWATDDVGTWLASGRLQTEAPRQWLLACLQGDVHATGHSRVESDVYEPQILPMAASMSWLLVTPAGNKRTMTGAELHLEAYAEQLKDIDLDDLSGRARAEKWSLDRLNAVMRATCDEALARLVRGNVLKVRGSGKSTGAAYELVHDQFGKPLQLWAADFEATPEYDLSALHAIQSRPFKWSGALAPHDDDGVIPHAVWRDCTLNKIDLSELTFRDCDFSDTLFSRCTFNNVTFENCVLSGATFKGAASFASVKMIDCDLGGAVFERGVRLQGVQIHGGEGLDFALFRGVRLSGCVFGRPADCTAKRRKQSLLDMHYVRFVDCVFAGENRFHRCDLDGAALSGHRETMRIEGALVFESCEMQGIELSNIDVSGHVLRFADCNCRGATLDRIDAGKDETGTPADVDFDRVTLVGATARGCTFEDVTFAGTADNRMDASSLVISDRPKTDRTPRVPSVLARLRFENLDAENMSLERCKVIDDIVFKDCMLSGATFSGDSRTRRLEGDMIFTDDCDLSATEFRKLDFTSEHQLQMVGCRGQGAFFREVTFSGDPGGQPAGVFTETDLAGALFWGCDMTHCRFSGIPGEPADMATLTIRPIVDRKTRDVRVPARVARLTFEHVNMQGFLLQDVEILDDIFFTDCDAGYGSIGRKDPSKWGRLRAHGDLVFDRCDMTAIEFSGIQFTDESLRILDSVCTSAMFWDVGFDRESEREVGLLVEASDLTCALLRDCEITRALMTGKSADEPSRAVSMTFIETKGDRAVLGDVVITNYVLDGSSFEGVSLVGPVRIVDSSLLRTKFTDLLTEEGGYLDVHESDLLYAQIDESLIADEAALIVTGPQRMAAESQRHYEDSLRFQGHRPRS